jgi:hypothetical protein
MTVCQWFDLKTTEMVSPGLASKLVATVSRFGPQNWQLQFSDLILEIIVMVSWFGPQNHEGYGLSVAPQNRQKMKTARGTCRDLVACFTRMM